MNQLINDVAIVLTQKIYTAIGAEVSRVNHGKSEMGDVEYIPSYFQIREKIYDTLVEYISEHRIEYEHGKFDSRMPQDYKERVLEDMEEKSAIRISRDLLSSNVLDVNEYKTDYYTKVRKTLLAININKLVDENRLPTEKSLEVARFYGKN